MSDLPSREQLTRVIQPWWQGGGTAVLLVDVCRREKVLLIEAEALAKRCGEIADKGYRITDELATRELGDLRSSLYRKLNGKREDDEHTIGSAAWLARATALAKKNEEFYAQFGGYDAAVKAVKWEKPAKQRKRYPRGDK